METESHSGYSKINDMGNGFQMKSASQTGAELHVTSSWQGVYSDKIKMEKSR